MSRQGRAHIGELAPLSVAKARPSAQSEGRGCGAGNLGLELSLQEANKDLTK